MASEVLSIDSLDSLIPSVEELVLAGRLAIHWAKAFEPTELVNLSDLPTPEEEVVDDFGYPYNSLDINGYPYNSSILPIINGLILPPKVAFGMYIVHKMTAGPTSDALDKGSIPKYPKNPIGPNTMHTGFEVRDLRPHHDGTRLNGGLTFHVTDKGNFDAEFGRQDYEGQMSPMSQGWDDAKTVGQLDLLHYSGVIKGGPGDVFIFPGYGLPHLNVHPVVHKITSEYTGIRSSAVFDPLSSIDKSSMPTLSADITRLIDFDASFTNYPMWRDYMQAA